MEGQSSHASSFKQYRSSVANKICMTLKNKFNKEISIRSSSGNRNRELSDNNASINNLLSNKDDGSKPNSPYRSLYTTNRQKGVSKPTHFIGDDYNDSKQSSKFKQDSK